MRVIDVTTNSMDAYKYFLKGRDNLDKFYPIEARENLEKAIAIDSSFATAHLYLSRAYSSLQETKKRNEALEKAYLYSEKATEKERLMINAYYASTIERNGEQQLRILNELAAKYPKEKIVHYELGQYFEYRDMHNEAIYELKKALVLDPNYSSAINQIAYIYSELGNYEKAIEYLKKYSQLNPEDANTFDSMADYYWRIGKIDLAIENYLKALNVKPDFFLSAAKLSYISAMKENFEEAERWINREIEFAPSTGLKSSMYWVRAFINSWRGKINFAIEDLTKARDLSETLSNKYVKAGSDWLQAFILYDTGKLEFVSQYYLEWLDYINKYSTTDRIDNIAEYKFVMALVNIKQNLIDSAKIKLAEIKTLMPKIIENKTRAEFAYDFLDAEILLAENFPLKAISAFETATQQDIPNLGYPIIVLYNVPFMKDGLGRAYYKAGQLDKAIYEYERLTTYNPQGKDMYLIHPRYHYRLAVLYEEKGLRDKAIIQYKKFLELWKDADKNLPEPIDAKKRLDKLLKKK
jgi:tetratricopeptide (TPR) repeat protein